MRSLVFYLELSFSYIHIAVQELDVCIGSSSKYYRLLLTLITGDLSNDLFNLEIAWYFILDVNHLNSEHLGFGLWRINWMRRLDL